MSTAPPVEFDDVSFAYGERAAVRNIRLQIEKGETLAIVGRSGAGKTTLLKLVNRLLLPTSGAVIVEGRDTRELGRHSRSAGGSATSSRMSASSRT